MVVQGIEEGRHGGGDRKEGIERGFRERKERDLKVE